MKTHTRDFKEEIKRFGRSIKGKIIYYPSYDLISESDDNILTENDLHLISEQANYGEPIEIREEDIFSINIIKNGDLLQSLMKEFDFESKIELNIGSVVNPQFGLLVNGDYEYLNYGNYIINSKEFNMDTETWSYVCYDKMLFSMIKYRELSNVQYPITIKQFINKLCDKVGLEFEDSEFVNQDQLIYEDLYKNRDVTYRDIFDEISKVVAGNLLINDNDKLEIKYIEKKEKLVPEQYTQLNYIENSNNEFIETNLRADENVKVELLINVSEEGNVLGVIDELGNRNFGFNLNFSINANNNNLCYFGLSEEANVFTNYSLNKDYKIQMDKNGIYVDGELIKTWTTSTINFQTIGTLNIFKTNTSYSSLGNLNSAKFKLYYCKIYEDENLIGDFIPCYRNSDNVVGLYDLVTQNFFTNNGDELFKKGTDYIEIINEDYLKDTNVKISEKIGVINSVAILDSDSNLQYLAEDTQSIKANEMTRITITDNLIAMNGETQEIANNILNKLNGLYYYANDFETTGVCYYDYLDLFNVEARGNIYQCLLLNNEITITQGIEEHIFTEKFEEIETSKEEYTTSVMTNKQASLRINQQEAKIEARVEKDGIISAINLSPEEIQIEANKISLEGKEINLTSDNIVIESNNFSVDEEGNLSCNNATMNDATMNNTTANNLNINGGNIVLNPTSGTGGLILNADSYVDAIEIIGTSTTTIQSASFSIARGTIGTFIVNSFSNGSGIVQMDSATIDGIITLDGSTGTIQCVKLNQSSKAERKKNFEKLTNAKEILNATDIYKYNFKDEDDTVKKSIGFVIGDDFNYSQDITSENNDGANIYSMVSVLWQVVKEYVQIIDKQQEEIKELKEMIKNGKH